MTSQGREREQSSEPKGLEPQSLAAVTAGGFAVFGQVTREDGSPFPEVTVRAFDRDLRSRALLGEVLTDAAGQYRIEYTAESFNRPEKRRADLIVTVLDREEELAASPVWFNAPPLAQVDLAVAEVRHKAGRSEFERIDAEISPVLEGVAPADLTDEDLGFLAADSGLDRGLLDLFRAAARLAAETRLPAEVFYGFVRQGLPADLDTLLFLLPAAPRRALEAALDANQIPGRLREEIGRILDELAALRLQREPQRPQRLAGRAVDAEGEPLPGLTVHGLDLDAPSGPQDLGSTVTDGAGRFGLTYAVPAAAATAPRRLRLTVLDAAGGQLLEQEVSAHPGETEIVVLQVTASPPPPPSPSLTELAGSLDVSLPSSLVTFLDGRGISTLRDLRQSGGLRWMSGLPVPPDHEAVRGLDAHASLSVLSEDVSGNTQLIRRGYTSFGQIAGATRAEFVTRAGAALGDFKAAQVHTVARAVKSTFDNSLAEFKSAKANGWSDSLPQTGPAAAAFLPECGCEDCQAAVSPLAYLADLLAYTLQHVKDGGAEISLSFLHQTFHQPFADLPSACEEMDKLVRQVRIAVEVLRAYLEAHSLPTGTAAQKLAQEEKRYRLEAYEGLLVALGTSYAEIRLARSAEPEERRALAERLGFDAAPDPLPPGQTDPLDALFLDPDAPAGDPRAITEARLEELFGLVDTTRDPLAPGPGPAAALTWRLQALRTLWERQDRPDDSWGEGRPVIDPDVTGPDDLRRPVAGQAPFDLWQARRAAVDAFLADLQTEREANGLDAILGQVFGTPLPDFDGLAAALAQGSDPEGTLAALTALSLTPQSFARLQELRVQHGDSAAEPLTAEEWGEVYAILAQSWKVQQFPAWVAEEAAAGVKLGPAAFWVALEEPGLPPWLATAETRALWRRALELRSGAPLIDPDLISAADLAHPVSSDPAFAVWKARRDWVKAQRNAIQAARQNAPTPLAGIEGVLADTLEIPVADLLALEAEREAGNDIGPRLGQLGLDLGSFAHLVRAHGLAAGGTPLLAAELSGVDAILTQVRKQRAFGTWREEEAAAHLVLGPDRFRIPTPPPAQFPPVDPAPLPEWLASRTARLEWQDVLQSRIDQEKGVADAFAESVGEVEGGVLPLLRDALVPATGIAGSDLAAKANALTSRLQIDARTHGGQKTTRVAQAIEALQNLLFSISTGQLLHTFPDLSLDADDFDAEWQWLGSYATWRAAMFVFLYPENILHPALRRWQTPAFRRLVSELRAQRRLDPRSLCPLAREYERYFRDVCTLTVEATCGVPVRLKGDCRSGQTDPGDRESFFLFARADSGRVYYSVRDLTDDSGYARSFWDAVPGLEQTDVSRIVGSVPYLPYAGERSIFLFVLAQEDGAEKLLFLRYDLDQASWAGMAEELELPEEAAVLSVLAVQDGSPQTPPVLAIRTKEGVYLRALDEDGEAWAEPEEEDDSADGGAWSPFLITPTDQWKIAELYAVLQTIVWTSPPDTETRPWVFCWLQSGQGWPKLKVTLIGEKGGKIREWEPDGGFVGAALPRNQFDLDGVHLFLRNAAQCTVQAIQAKESPLGATFAAPSGMLGVVPRYGSMAQDGDATRLVFEVEGAKYGDRPIFYEVLLGDAFAEVWRSRTSPRVEEPSPGPGFVFDITDRLDEGQLQQKRQATAAAYLLNRNDPYGSAANLAYLAEAWYFVPLQLALELQGQGHYPAALEWFRSVYDYSAPTPQTRKIYFGLIDEESLPKKHERTADWLLDPLNPHAVAATRRRTYTRATLISLVSCLLDFADAEFTRDTAESLPRARTLYLTALRLMDEPELKQSLGACDDIIGTLEIEVGEGEWWAQGWFQQALAPITSQQLLSEVVDDVKTAMSASGSWQEGFEAAQGIVTAAVAGLPAKPTVGELFAARAENAERLHAALLSDAAVAKSAVRAGSLAAQDCLLAVSKVSGHSASTLQHENVVLPWLKQPVYPMSGGGPSGGGWKEVSVMPAWQKVQVIQHWGPTYVPAPVFDFCIPPNPLLRALRLHAEVNLFKLRNGRNIAGMLRELDPYAAPTDTESGLPMIGAGGALVLPGLAQLRPTPYRYTVLVERAQQLAGMAQMVEASFLATLEKRDAELYNLLRARQDVRLARAGVRLQGLRLQEARGGVRLAELQQERAQLQVDYFQGLLDEGISTLEMVSVLLMAASAGMQTAAAIAAAADLRASADQTLSHGAAAASTAASVAATFAAYERRAQEWEFQRNLSQQDVLIGAQQVKLAEDRVRVVGQERVIAELQTEHAEATAEFLANKFTNVELYDWMSGILEEVYGFFLQQATAMALLATQQLAFERQELPPAFIQADYWEAPSDSPLGGAVGEAPDRRGLTGAARLLRDIVQLDQYAFETNRRKLQLTKTLSLARLAPVELQRFRETGVMTFATPMELFDRDFPGHYLRLIRRVRVSVAALIPPGEGIRATLTTTGTSRVVIGGDLYQETVLNRGPESVALTSPRDATGLFDLDPQSEMLLPFEGLGVDTTWELRMPRPANPFDFSTLSDVLMTFEYTALDSYDYRLQVLQSFKPSVSAERPFSFRHQLSDPWYDLHNPEQTATPMTVRFTTRRADFPPHLENLKIQHVALYVSRAGSSPAEVEVSHLWFKEEGGAGWLGGGAVSIDGLISTRKANAGSWAAILGRSPFGAWELALPNTAEMRNRFHSGAIQDILLVLTFSGQPPAWPS